MVPLGRLGWRARQVSARDLPMFRFLPLAVVLALAVCTGANSHAQSSNTTSSNGSLSGPLIFDVRRSMPLEPNEPVYKDFYINAGPEAGFKKGVYIAVVRPIPIHDPIQNKQQGTLNVPVGHLQVIHVDRGITVARMQDELSDEERPTLEFEGVMVGDKIDLGSMTTTAPKRPAPAKKSGFFGAVAPTETQETAKLEVKLEALDSASVAPAAAPEAQPNAPAQNKPEQKPETPEDGPLPTQPAAQTLPVLPTSAET